MAPARVAHFVEAKILEDVRVNYVDKSEILAMANENYFINKHNFRCPLYAGVKIWGKR